MSLNGHGQLRLNIYRFPTEDSHFKEYVERIPMNKREMNVS